jgi:hypothetical protein
MGDEENKQTHREGVPNYGGRKKNPQLEFRIGSLNHNPYTYT